MKKPPGESARDTVSHVIDAAITPVVIRRQRLAMSLWTALVLALTPLASGQDTFSNKWVSCDCASCDSVVVPSKEFCEWWKNLGTLYSNADDPYVQELKFVGRFHYQYGLVDGEAAGNDVSYDTDEMRRFRTGITSKFLDYWDLYAEAEISDDLRPQGADLDIRFQHMWQLKLHFDAKKAFGLEGIDGLKIGAGSREINMSYEWVTSSKRIKTVERSAIANKIWAFNSEFANPTGAWVTVELTPVTWTFGVFSTTQDDWIAPFDDGELYYSNLHWNVHKGPDDDYTDIRWTAFYQDRNTGDQVLAAGLDWATALSVQHQQGPWKLHIEGIAGNNGDQSNGDREGSFWAAVVMPSYWIVDDSLEAVVRFQYQGSDESQGIRLNSRYVRRAGSRENIPTLANGRGDEHSVPMRVEQAVLQPPAQSHVWRRI